mgnify:CR=1 FL=1
MANVSLSSSVRQNLLAMQATNDMMTITQNRLATGKRVNSALDNATNYFTSSALQGRASDLSNLLDSISNATKTIEAANNGIEGIKKLVESAQSIARQVKAGGDATSLDVEYQKILTQIDELASDSGYNGINLIKGTADELTVDFNEDGSSTLAVTGVDLDSAGLAISGTDVTDADEAEASLDALAAALTTLRTTASTLGSNLSTIQARQNFTKSMVATLKGGADNLVNADINEEAATLLALQTRSQLSQTALSMSNQQDQSVLRLFS